MRKERYDLYEGVNIGYMLKQFREARNIRMGEMAHTLDKDRATIMRWERERTKISLSDAQKYLGELGLSLAVIPKEQL